MIYLRRKFEVLLSPVVENAQRTDNEERVSHTTAQVSRERYSLECLCRRKRENNCRGDVVIPSPDPCHQQGFRIYHSRADLPSRQRPQAGNPSV